MMTLNYPPAPGPQPGDVFREIPYQYLSWPNPDFAPNLSETDPSASSEIAHELQAGRTPETPIYLWVDDLDGAVRAELAIEYWGGHIGTSLRGFRVNDSDWLPIPIPGNTPTRPECYYKCLLGNPPALVPLEHLHLGANAIRFGAGPQVAYNFDCGFFWVYCATLRIYYQASKPHPEGHILMPVNGLALGENPLLSSEGSSSNGPVVQVDYIALYEDFDWEGDGVFRKWHYNYRYGLLMRHMGRATNPPFSSIWNTSWIPDQREPISVMARLTDASGMCTMTRAVEGLRLERWGHSVKMFKPSGVPENFGSRIGQRKSCTIDVVGDLSQAYSARLVLSTWSAAHADEITFNNKLLVQRIGKVHDVSFDSLDVPVDLIHPGANTFSIYSATEEHAAEVNWPGPVLLVKLNR